MNKIIALILFFISLSSFGAKGIIVVHEAPLHQKPSIKSKVLQLVRKGQKIYIHNQHLKSNFDSKSNFYQTLDRNGNTAHIAKDYVKLITNDLREKRQAISPFSPDPTDYRLQEPLPKNYPFIKDERHRGQVSILAGPDMKANYIYPQVILEERYSFKRGFQLSYLKKANWDEKDRFYFGGEFTLWFSEARYTLLDFTEAQEARGQISVGPLITYDLWRGHEQRLTLKGSLPVHWSRMLVAQSTTETLFEERSFSGFSVSPKLGAFFQFEKLVYEMDLFFGSDIQFHLPQKLKSKTAVQIPELWQASGSALDSIDVPFQAHWSLYLGFQTHY